MALDANALRRRAAQQLSVLSTGQKVGAAAAVVALLVGAILFTGWAGKPTYAPLYTQLESSDAAAITEKLSADGVSYRLADGGSTVLVPRAELYQRRIEMSGAGLPSGGNAGWSLLDKQGITASEFRQRVDFQRALEGELSRTIMAIDGVAAATVHLVIPKDDLFSEDEKRPTASVLLKTAPGQAVAPGKVQAVVHLVASSVEGLAPADVTVADAKGSVLSSGSEDGADLAAGDARAQQTQAFEQRLGSSLESLLSPLVGPSGAVVQVKAELDFDQRSATTERFDREDAPVVSESSSRETLKGGSPMVGGVLGPDAPAVAAGGETDYQKEDAERQYAVGRTTEEVRQAPGQVRRLSLAVVLDAKAGPKVAAADVERLVAAAAGIDPDRGDRVEVRRLAFDDSAEKEAAAELAAAEADRKREQLLGLLRTVAVVVVVVLLLLYLRRASRRARRAVSIPLEALPSGGNGSEVLDLSELRDADQLTPGMQQDHPRALPTVPPSPQLVAQQEIAELVDRQPDEVAELLRGWLAERRS